MSSRALLILLTLLGPLPAMAGGFRINEQGARATGKAGAFVAEASDASAITYNPAGLAELDGLQIHVGLSVVSPSISYTSDTTSVTTTADLQCPLKTRSLCSSTLATIPNLYLSFELTSDSTIGLGITSPFGLGLRWNWHDDSPERFEIERQSLSTLFFSPVVALDASSYLDGLAVALGADIAPAHTFLRRDIPLGQGEGEVRLSGDATGAGGRLGLLYTPPFVSGWRAGLTWRSPMTLNFHGSADFETKGQTPRSALPPDGDTRTQLTLPQALAFGLSFSPGTWLAVEANIEWLDWSVFDQIDIRLPDGSSLVDDKDWTDTLTLRGGAVLALGPVSVRGGVAYDPSPVPSTRLDPTLPDADRLLIGMGFGVELPWSSRVELSGLYVPTTERQTSPEPGTPLYKGTYTVSAWAISGALVFTFGTMAEPPAAEAKPEPEKKVESEPEAVPEGESPSQPTPEAAAPAPEES